MKGQRLPKSHFRLLPVLISLFALALFLGCQKNSLDALQKDIIKLKQDVGQSVVCLTAENLKDKSFKLGSGIVVDKNHILTTENFLGGAEKIRILLQDGRVIEDSDIINKHCDFETNISLLEVRSKNLKPIKKFFKGKMESGVLGVALFNNQYSKGLCAVFGSVSPSWIGGDDVYDEELLIFNPLYSYLCSGTPVFNSKGEFLGLVEGESREHRGMVLLLPATTCEKVSQVLVKNGRVERGWIGIVSDKTCKDTCLSKMMEQSPKGVLITEIDEKSPAYECGLKPGDLIVKCDNEEISCKTKFRKTISAQPVNSKLILGIVRQNKKMDVKIDVKPRPEVPAKRRCSNRSI